MADDGIRAAEGNNGLVRLMVRFRVQPDYITRRKRICLSCNQEFVSAGPWNRICTRSQCQNRGDELGRVKYVSTRRLGGRHGLHDNDPHWDNGVRAKEDG